MLISNKFKLILSGQSSPRSMVLNSLASKYGILSPVGSVKLVRINKEVTGLFSFTEHQSSKEFITSYFGHNEVTILKNFKDWRRKETEYRATPHSSYLESSSIHYKNKNTKRGRLALHKLHELLDAIKNKNINIIKTLVDVEYFSKTLALQQLFGSQHFIFGDNITYYFNHKNNKFYYLFREESPSNLLDNKLIENKGRAHELFSFANLNISSDEKNDKSFVVLLKLTI